MSMKEETGLLTPQIQDDTSPKAGAVGGFEGFLWAPEKDSFYVDNFVLLRKVR